MPTIQSFLPGPPHWTLDWGGIDLAFPWIRALRGSTQDPVHHAEGDVWTHVAMVAAELVAAPEWRAGANEARQILRRMGWPVAAWERVCAMIRVHRAPFWLLDREAWERDRILAQTSLSSSSGAAVISFDLSSTQRWPSTRPCSLAQALTPCSGDCSRSGSNKPRIVMPSMAITLRSNLAASEPTLNVNPVLKASGSISMNTRRKVS